MNKKPRADYWEDTPMPPLAHPTTFDPGPRPTGVLDKDGRPLMHPVMPLGFPLKKVPSK